MGIINHLEGAVVLDHPGHLLAQERAHDLGGEAVVVLRRQTVADVMQQRRHHPVDIGAIAPRPGRRLQRVLQPGDAVACQGFLALPGQFAQQPVRRAFVEWLFQLVQHLVFFLCRLVEPYLPGRAVGQGLCLRRKHLFVQRQTRRCEAPGRGHQSRPHQDSSHWLRRRS
jgi:hypothetical protein